MQLRAINGITSSGVLGIFRQPRGEVLGLEPHALGRAAGLTHVDRDAAKRVGAIDVVEGTFVVVLRKQVDVERLPRAVRVIGIEQLGVPETLLIDDLRRNRLRHAATTLCLASTALEPQPVAIFHADLARRFGIDPRLGIREQLAGVRGIAQRAMMEDRQAALRKHVGIFRVVALVSLDGRLERLQVVRQRIVVVRLRVHVSSRLHSARTVDCASQTKQNVAVKVRLAALRSGVEAHGLAWVVFVVEQVAVVALVRIFLDGLVFQGACASNVFQSQSS